jgi:hypothetical protein
MSDKDHADAIQATVLNLNRVIEAAANDGMFCELMIFHNHADERSIPKPVVFAKPYKLP